MTDTYEKTKQINIALNEEDYRKLIVLMFHAGTQNKSGYVRSLINREHTRFEQLQKKASK